MECFAWAYVTSLTRTRVNLIDLHRELRTDRSASPTSNPLTGLAAEAWIRGSRVHRSRPSPRSALASFLQFQSSCVARRPSASPIPKDHAPGSVRGYLTSPSPFVPKHKRFQWGHPPTPVQPFSALRTALQTLFRVAVDRLPLPVQAPASVSVIDDRRPFLLRTPQAKPVGSSADGPPFRPPSRAANNAFRRLPGERLPVPPSALRTARLLVPVGFAHPRRRCRMRTSRFGP